jgi:hypothetical protein
MANNDITYFDEPLGKSGVRVTFKSFKGRDLLHIRLHDEYGYPTRKGVCLTQENVRKLRQEIVQSAIESMESKEEKVFEITEEIRLQTTKYGDADLRLFWKPQDDYVPTRIGTPIRFEEFKRLEEILRDREHYFYQSF